MNILAFWTPSVILFENFNNATGYQCSRAGLRSWAQPFLILGHLDDFRNIFSVLQVASPMRTITHFHKLQLPSKLWIIPTRKNMVSTKAQGVFVQRTPHSHSAFSSSIEIGSACFFATQAFTFNTFHFSIQSGFISQMTLRTTDKLAQ